MSGKRKSIMDIRELLRHMRSNVSNRGVQRETHIDRRTVKQYRAWASEQGLLEGPLPSSEELQALVKQTLGRLPPPQNVSSVEGYREVVTQLVQEGTEVAAIWQRLREQDYGGSYSSVLRFVRKLDPPEPEVTVRVERKPGEEAQVDFGNRWVSGDRARTSNEVLQVLDAARDTHQELGHFRLRRMLRTLALPDRHLFQACHWSQNLDQVAQHYQLRMVSRRINRLTDLMAVHQFCQPLDSRLGLFSITGNSFTSLWDTSGIIRTEIPTIASFRRLSKVGRARCRLVEGGITEIRP